VADRRAVFPVLSALLLVLSVPALACGPSVPPRITVALDIPEPTFSHRQTSEGIPGRSDFLRRRTQELNSRLNGLTKANLVTGHQMHVRERHPGGGCFGVTGLEVWIRIKDFSVYVASELAVGSCRYDVTLRHEMKHVAVFRQGAQRLQQRWQAELDKAGLARPIPAASAEQAHRRLSSAVQTLMNDIRQQEWQRMTRENALLDTPSAYRAEYRQCDP